MAHDLPKTGTHFSGSCALGALFGVLLKLLLESSELGKGRIGIRLLVVASGTLALRFGVIALAIGAFDLVAFVAAARTIRRRRAGP